MRKQLESRILKKYPFIVISVIVCLLSFLIISLLFVTLRTQIIKITSHISKEPKPN